MFPHRRLTQRKRSVDVTKRSPSLTKITLNPAFRPFTGRGSAESARAIHSYLPFRLVLGQPFSPRLRYPQSIATSSLEDSRSGTEISPSVGSGLIPPAQRWTHWGSSFWSGKSYRHSSAIVRATLPLGTDPRLHRLPLLFCSGGNLSFRGCLLVFFSLPPKSPFNWIIPSFRRVAPF